MTRRVYMDNHATTAVDQRVVDAMLPCFTQTFGNSGSRNHAFARSYEEHKRNVDKYVKSN